MSRRGKYPCWDPGVPHPGKVFIGGTWRSPEQAEKQRAMSLAYGRRPERKAIDSARHKLPASRAQKAQYKQLPEVQERRRERDRTIEYRMKKEISRNNGLNKADADRYEEVQRAITEAEA